MDLSIFYVSLLPRCDTLYFVLSLCLCQFLATDAPQCIVLPFARQFCPSVRLSVRDKSEHCENGER